MQDIKPAIQQIEAACRRLERASKLLVNGGYQVTAQNINGHAESLRETAKYLKRDVKKGM